MSGELFTRVVCPECNNDDRGLGALPCSHCSGGHIYTKVQVATPPGFERVPEGTMALLERVEFTAHNEELMTYECALCPGSKRRPHNPDCEMGRILTAHRATQNGGEAKASNSIPSPRMSLHEAEMYADEMESATIDYFRSSTVKNSKRFCDVKAKLILALTGAQQAKETPNAQG